ncbi:hypothetical protein [Lysinibacillus xylanilyticus]|uniref:Uncharacterized protein n=1 Tax=Lysinibacillus xylanilyticus TaxID=582475 RepID=A0ABT4ER64_9BACI|nr:hypothetical protein [Lysinibacillus xylanilyticus]MCY9548162.1 hypothetical protein [Lysinibacillus xylanilyticus]
MNTDLGNFSSGVQMAVPDATLSVQKTSAEIKELSLRTPRSVATTE